MHASVAYKPFGSQLLRLPNDTPVEIWRKQEAEGVQGWSPNPPAPLSDEIDADPAEEPASSAAVRDWEMRAEAGMMVTGKTERPFRVVILGAGFGGLETARALSRAPVEITLIDRHNYPAVSWSPSSGCGVI
jgi:hypothetical protein